MLRPTLVLLIAFGAAPASGAAEFTAREMEFFETKIRPLLLEHCSECHGAEAEPAQGGLRTDHREALLRGGDSGPAVVPGQPSDSLLLYALRYGDLFQMPPSGKLPDSVVADFERWVQSGAPVPAGDPPLAAERNTASIDAGQHWAFQELRDPEVPLQDSDWDASPIDRFVLAGLEQAKLRPSPPADKSTLIRRAYFDLVGLPPKPEQVQAFLSDNSPGAFAQLVDDLLASPRYGERWGRYWLDLARFADSNGADENYAYHHAWRYRDYVVAAFNQDKPYDQFVIEQLAGDLLPAVDDPQLSQDQLTATGFLVLGPKMLAEQDKEKLVVDVVDEQIDTVGRTFLGLTLGCARCHDHKFDPVPTEDYYALAGIFLSTRTMQHLDHVSKWLERPLGEPQEKRYRELESQIAAKAQERDAIEIPADAGDPAALQAKQRKEQVEAEIKQLQTELAAIPVGMAVEDQAVRDVPIHIRGSHLNLAAEVVPRGTLGLLQRQLSAPPIPPSTSGRLELARWIVDPRNSLTARVMVNRLWQGHFGEGLVRTPSDFGLRGAAPTHPELLDWLAQRFIDSGWSLKEMHRMIMLSSTYQMASDSQTASDQHGAATVDPENRLLWRQNRRRLEVEPLRDSLLAVSGKLDLSLGGALDDTPRTSDYVQTTEAPYQIPRRTIYLPVVRNRAYEMFTIFDYVDAGVHLEQRSTTTVPHQALFMMNNPLMMQQAEALAAELLQIESVDERLEQAYLLLFSRALVRAQERELAKVYLVSLPPQHEALRWASLCRVLLATNEFLYVD